MFLFRRIKVKSPQALQLNDMNWSEILSSIKLLGLHDVNDNPTRDGARTMMMMMTSSACCKSSKRVHSLKLLKQVAVHEKIYYYEYMSGQ